MQVPFGIRTTKTWKRSSKVSTGEQPDSSPLTTGIAYHQLLWDTLVNCHRTSRLIMLYKISHGLVDTHAPTYLTPGDKRTRGARKYLQLSTGKEVYDNSFFSRTIHDWNNLPPTVRLANSIEALRMLLTQAACSSQWDTRQSVITIF
jgi:hypothetical protein